MQWRRLRLLLHLPAHRALHPVLPSHQMRAASLQAVSLHSWLRRLELRWRERVMTMVNDQALFYVMILQYRLFSIRSRHRHLILMS